MKNFLSELKRLMDAATKGPWWEWPGMPYLFSGNKDKPNAYYKDDVVRVGRFDYTQGDKELIAYLVNHAPAIAELVKAADLMLAAWEHDTYKDFVIHKEMVKEALAKLNANDVNDVNDGGKHEG